VKDEKAVLPPEEVPTSSASASAAAEPNADDEDEDDPDYADLDDILDEFSPSQPDQRLDAPSSSGPGRPAVAPPPAAAPATEADEEFMQKLQAGMGDLMGSLDADPQYQKELDAFAQAMEKEGMQPEDLLKAFMGAESESPGVKAAQTAVAGSSSAGGEENFQETIRKTMERMQNSGDSATAAATSAGEDDMLANLLKAMEASGGADGDEEGLTKMFLGMMEQLTNKEMLYEPMKELDGKFPQWIEENKGKLSKEDLEKYTTQRDIVKDIVTKFEQKGYTDENPAHRQYIWEKMQKMQAAGSPPEDLIANPLKDTDLGAGPDMPGCPQQ